jgi:mRNA interferase RelE/StbE
VSEPGPGWQVVVHRRAERALRRLPRDVLERIRRAIGQLAVDPRPPGCQRLTNTEDLYRIRVGDWRIIYAIEDERLIVLIVDVGPRGSIYRGL